MSRSPVGPTAGGVGESRREEATRRPYRPPRLRLLGHVADVTRKTGMNMDMQQNFKVGAG